MRKKKRELDPFNPTAISCPNAMKNYGLLSRFKDHIALVTDAFAVVVAIIRVADEIKGDG